MKIFASVFFAILAACAVVWFVGRPFYLYSEAKSEAHAMYHRAYAFGMQKTGDPFADLRTINQATDSMNYANERLILVLKRKPFGLPLSPSEKRELEECEKSVSEHQSHLP